MSVENKVVTASFDNSKFERNIKTTIGSLNKFKASISSMVGSNKTFQELGRTADSVKVKFSSLQVVAVSALENIANSAINTGKQLMKSLSVDQLSAGFEQYSKLIVSTQTIAAAHASKSIDEINNKISRLEWFTDETSYNIQTMVDTIGKFSAAGRDLDTSVTTMMGIANWAAEAGANANTASTAMYQLSQALGRGNIALEDWKSIQTAAMDTRSVREEFIQAAVAAGTLKEVSEGVWKSTVKGGAKVKVTLDNFTDTLTKGKWLTTDVFESAMGAYGQISNDIFDLYNHLVEGKELVENETFTKEMVDSYKQIIDEQGLEIDTTTDLINLIESTIDATGEMTAETEKLSKGLKRLKLAQVARTWEDVVGSLQKGAATQWSGVFTAVFGDLEKATERFTDLANELWDVFVAPIQDVKLIVQDFAEKGGLDLLWSKEEGNLGAVWNIVEALKSYVQVVYKAVEKIFGKVDGDKLISWAEKVQEFTKSLILDEKGINKWANTLKTVYSALKNYYGFIKQVVNTISIAISGGGTSIRGVINTVAGLMNKAFGTGRKVLSYFNKAFSAVMKQVKGAFTDVFGSDVGLFKTIVNVAKDLFGNIAKNKDLLKNIRVTLRGVFELAVRIKDLFFRIVDTIREVFGIEKKEGNPLVNLLAKIFEWTSKIFGNIKNNDKLDKFENGFVTFVRTVAEILKSVWNLVKDIFNAGKNLFSEVFGKDSEKTMGKSIGDFIKNTVEAVRNFVKDVSSNENFINFLKTVVDVGSKVIDFFKEFWNVLFEGRSVGEVVGDAFGWIGDVFGGLFGKGGTEEAGEMTVKGFAQGIANGVKWVYSVIVNLVSTVISVIKNLLGIHSPSAVTEQIGEYFVEGFGAGIDKKAPGILDKLKEFFDKIKDFFSRVAEGFREASDAESSTDLNAGAFKAGDIAGNLGKMIHSLYEFFKSLTIFSVDIITRGLKIFSEIGRAIFDLLVSNDVARRIVLAIVSLGLIALAVKKVWNQISWKKGYIDVLENFSYMIESVGDYFWEMSEKQKAERFKIITSGIKDIALAMVLSVAALGWLAKTIDDMWNKNAGALITAIVIFGALIGVLTFLTLKLNETNRATSKWDATGRIFAKNVQRTSTDNSVSRNVAVLGTFLLAFGAAMMMLGKVLKEVLEAVNSIEVDAEHPEGAIIKLSAVVVLLGLMISSMIFATTFLYREINKNKKGKLTTNTLLKQAKNMIVMMLIINQVCKMMKTASKALIPIIALSKDAKQIMAATAGLTILFAAIAGLCVVMSRTFDKIDLFRLVGLTPLLLVITTLMQTLGTMLASVTGVVALTGNYGALWSSVGAISALLTAMMGALALLGTFQASKLLAGAAALTVLSASIATIAASIGSLVVVMSMLDPEKLNPHGALWSVTLAVAGLLAAMMGVMAVLGKNESMTGKVMAIGGAFALMGVGIALATSSLMLLALAFKMFMDLAVKFKETSTDTITGFFEKAGLAMKTAITTFFDVMQSVRGRLLQFVISLIVDLMEVIRATSPAVEKTVVQTVLGLIKIGYETLPAFNEFIVAALYDLLKTVLKHLPGLLSVAVEIGVVAFEALLELLSRTNLILIQAILQFIVDAIPILVEGLGDAVEALVAAIPGLLYKLARAIYNHGTEIIDAANAIGQALTYTLTYGLTRSFNIGSILGAVFGGLFRGAKKNVDDVEKTGQLIGGTLEKSTKDELGIKSPSKVMMEIGKYTVEGLTKGINENQNDVKESAVKMGKNVDDSYRNYMGIHSASKRMEEDGVWTVEGVTKGTSNSTAIARLGGSIENLARHVGSTYTDTITTIVPEMIDTTLKAAKTQATALYSTFGPEYFWEMYSDPEGMSKKYLSEFAAQSQAESAAITAAIGNNKSETTKLRNRLGSLIDSLYGNDYLTGDVFKYGYSGQIDKSGFMYLSDQELINFINRIEGYMKQYGPSHNYAAATRRDQFKAIDSLIGSTISANRESFGAGSFKEDDSNLTPVEKIWNLLSDTKTKFGNLLGDVSSSLGLDKLGDLIGEKFKNALGFGGESNFLDGLTSKIGGLFGVGDEEGGSLMDKMSGLIPSAEDLMPAGMGADDVGAIFNGNSDTGSYDYSTVSNYASSAASDAKGGAWGRVPVSSNTDNSNTTINNYIYAADEDAAYRGVSRAIQKQAERRTSEWH